LILKNKHYFGNFYNELEIEIKLWWIQKKQLEIGREAMEFAEQLTDKYYSEIMENLSKQIVT
jgi:hypothetical protein